MFRTLNREERAKIGSKLKEYRLSRQWTLEQLAELSGLAVSCVWQIENGKTVPSELTIAKLSRVLPDLTYAA